MRQTTLTSFLIICIFAARAPAADLYPAKSWKSITPQEAGLSATNLDALAQLATGRGCVVRHGQMVYTWGEQSKSGDVASAFKPVLTTLMLIAVQDGKLHNVDDRLADVEPRLKGLNNGKDGAITWRHLANQISGYGLIEKPGEAYSYNDFALALYYDTLMEKVYKQEGTAVLKEKLADPLGFEDLYTFNAFGPKNRPGRLAISCRDFARIGVLYLRGGKWNDKQILRNDLLEMAISSPLAVDFPRTSGQEAPMLANQRSIGGTRNITPEGPGYYSFNWWLNRKDKDGRVYNAALPADAYIAAGHGGLRQMIIVPSLDLIVVWNDAKPLQDNKANQEKAAKLLVEAVR